MSWLENLYGRSEEDESKDERLEESRLKEADLSKNDTRPFDASAMNLEQYNLKPHIQEMQSEETQEKANDIKKEEPSQNSYHWMENASDQSFADEEAEWKRGIQERLEEQSPERLEELREKYPELFDNDDGDDENPAAKKLLRSRARHT